MLSPASIPLASSRAALVLTLDWNYLKVPDMPAGISWARSGIQSESPYEAIVRGEKTAITIVPKDPISKGRSQGVPHPIKSLKPGQFIRFIKPGHPHAIVQVVLSQKSVQQSFLEQENRGRYPALGGLCDATYAISLDRLRAHPNELEVWSRLESLHPDVALKWLATAPDRFAYQVRFEFKGVDSDVI